ncbi:MAG: response regulator [Planctomycetes bacterium]|nr:response regulator [Planctomycetota bacterium]
MKLATRRLLLACSILACGGLSAHALGTGEGAFAREFRMRRWDAGSGLPGLSARSLAQTADGYVWVGTFDGLARVDGQRATPVRELGGAVGRDRSIVALHVDRRGWLWAGTMGAVLCYDGAAWRRLGLESNWPGSTVFWIAELPDGRVLFSSDHGVFACDGQLFEPFALPPEFDSEVRHPRIAVDSEGHLWAMGASQLARFDGTQWTSVATRDGLDHWRGLTPAADGGVWALDDSQLWRVRGTELECVASVPESCRDNEAVLLEDREGGLWVGLYADGLLHLSATGELRIVRESQGLPSSQVAALLADREGGVWVGTGGAGAVRLERRQFHHVHGASHMATENTITALATAADGRTWLGTLSGDVIEVENDIETALAEPLVPSDPSAISALRSAPDGALWIGTDRAGLWRARDGELECVVRESELRGAIRELRCATDLRVWLVSGDALGLFERDSVRWIDLQGAAVSALESASDGAAWVATSRGMFEARDAEASPRLVLDLPGLHALHTDAQGTLYGLTNECELLIYRGATARLLGARDGFELPRATALFSDTHRDLWLADSTRLVRIPRDSLELEGLGAPRGAHGVEFGEPDGLVIAVPRPSGVCTAKGELWLTTDRGAARFDPSELEFERAAPQVIFESAVVDNRSFELVGDTLELPAGVRCVSLQLAAPQHSRADAVHFQLKLDDAPEWHALGASRALELTELGAGDYLVHVRAANGDGPFGPTRTLRATVEPLLWQRTDVRAAAWLVGLTGVFSIASLLHRRRLRTIAGRNAERLRIAKERARTADTLRLVTDAVPAQLFYVSIELRLLWCNRAFREAHAAGREVRAGDPWGVLLDEATCTRWTPLMERALRGESVQASSFSYFCDAGERSLEVSFVPQLDGAGSVVGVFGLCVDISERVVLERRLRQAQKLEAMGTFAGGIAHDFNNILAAILGSTELALSHLDDRERAHRQLAAVVASCERARDLVQRILTFSKRGSTPTTALDLGSEVEHSLESMRPSLPGNVELVTRLEHGANVLADRVQVHQIVTNLCGNAAQALEGRRGTVEVTLSSAGDPARAVLTVRDDGCGMTQAVKERVFEPFFSTKPAGRGTGLGLPVVHGVVRELGGTIDLESELGVGTTFRVELPLAATAVARAVVPTPQPALRAQGERVLIVEDEPAVRTVFGMLLERGGYRVESFESVEAALAAFRARPGEFDLVFTDLALGDGDGQGLAAQVHRVSPRTPVVLVTGNAGELDEARARREGFAALVHKPFESRAVLALARRLIQERQGAESSRSLVSTGSGSSTPSS